MVTQPPVKPGLGWVSRRRRTCAGVFGTETQEEDLMFTIRHLALAAAIGTIGGAATAQDMFFGGEEDVAYAALL